MLYYLLCFLTSTVVYLLINILNNYYIRSGIDHEFDPPITIGFIPKTVSCINVFG